MLQYELDSFEPRAEIDFEMVNTLTSGKSLLDYFNSDNIYVIDSTGNYTYREVFANAKKIASHLKVSYNLSKGDKVVIRSENSIESISTVIALWMLGATPSLVMPMFREEEISYILGHIDPKLYLSSNSLPKVGEKLISINEVYDEALENPIEDFELATILSTDVAVILFTSGTTGKNKSAMLTHGELLANALSFSTHIGLSEKDKFISSASMAFSYGMGIFFSFPIANNASVIITKNAKTLLGDAVEQQATVLFLVPTLYNIFMVENNDSLLNLRDKGAITKFVSAGENLSELTYRFYYKLFNIGIINGLGATEMTHIFLANTAKPHNHSLGVPLNGYEIELRDKDNKLIELDDTIGYLHVKGISGCKYYRDERQNQYVTDDNFNKTNDLLYRVNGEYYYHSRADEMIITSGYNVSPYEIEDCIKRIPGVMEVLVCGQPDKLRNHVIAAYIKTNVGFTLTDSEVMEFVKQELAPYKYPRRIFFVDEFPRTASGKLKRTALISGEFYNTFE
jgi:2-aminobenzoate-CoA ligase